MYGDPEMKTTMRGKTALFIISLATCVFIVTGCSGEKPVTAAGVNNKELAGHTAEFKQEIIKITDGVYVAIGYGLANPAVALAKGDVKIEGGIINMVNFLGLFSD